MSRFAPRIKQERSKVVPKNASKGSSGSKTFEIEISKVKNILKTLQPYANAPIKNLKGDAEESFKSLLVYVSVSFNTDYYAKLCEIIRDNFICPDKIVPGTVGGYICGGVIAFKRGDLECCSLTCASGMPNPNKAKCNHNIIKAVKKSDRYTFEMINRVPSADKCIIYVPELNPSVFSGFTEDEKKKLKDLGKNFKIVGYSHNSDQEVPIQSEFGPLKDVKRKINITSSYVTKPGNGFLILILTLLLLLVLIVIGWKVISSSGRNDTGGRTLEI